MEKINNEVVENIQEALNGMVIKVGIQPNSKDLLKIGVAAMMGSAMGTLGCYAIAGWRQKRKMKKVIDEINNEV